MDTDPVDFAGTLLIEDMGQLLHCSVDTIRRRVREGTFPIPTLKGIDNKLRWAGPVVRRWLDDNGFIEDQPTGRRAR